MNEVAYTPEAPDNPNFVSRPPDPGYLRLYGTVGWDALYHSPFSGAYRMSQLNLESNDYFNVDGNLLTPEQANSKYGMHGQLKFDEPVKESAAQLMMQRKIDENDRNYVIGSGMTSGFRQAAGIGVGMAATLLDPINFASMFVPVVGEARFARMVQRFGGSVLKARLAAGAIEGATGAAMVEPFVLLPALQEQANYDLKDSAANLGYGAALGGMLHAGFGAIGDRLKKLKPRESDAMFESAMNNVLKDEPVETPAKLAEFTDSHPTHTAENPSQIVQIPDQPETLGQMIGQQVEYAGYTGKLIRDAEGNFVVLREVTTDGKPAYIEVANTGKDMELKASDAEVYRPGYLDKVKTAKEQGLQNLQEQINSTKIRTDDQSRVEQRGSSIDKDTKTDIPRLDKEQMKSPSETPRLLTDIEKETADLEKSLNLEGDMKTRFEEQMKTEIGDQPKREIGVKSAVECIVRNLI